MSIGQPTAAVDPPRTLVLFSDGTGNSSAKLFKTNVWRMYEAVDLGPDSAAGPLQIAYYDNGIGTHAFRNGARVTIGKHEFDETVADYSLRVAVDVSGDAQPPSGMALVCRGTAWIEGDETKVALFRAQ